MHLPKSLLRLGFSFQFYARPSGTSKSIKAILFDRPNDNCQENLKSFDHPLFSSDLFSAIWCVKCVLQNSAWLRPTMSKMC